MTRENQLVNGGGLLILLGAAAFFLPMLDRQLVILMWLGSMQQPVGLSAMVIGGILFAMGKLQDFRDSSPIPTPTDELVPNQLAGSQEAAQASQGADRPSA
jgi:hypothetical protein